MLGGLAEARSASGGLAQGGPGESKPTTTTTTPTPPEMEGGGQNPVSGPQGERGEGAKGVPEGSGWGL